MKNREKFAKEILDIACSGDAIAVIKGENKVIPCSKMKWCEECEFCDACIKKTMEWCEAEYEEPRVNIPPDAPVDTKILVSHDGKKWIRRYFAGFDGGLVVAWHSGATSWSSDNKTYCWKYGKLAEDENNDKN